jgi:WD40 repeat protein
VSDESTSSVAIGGQAHVRDSIVAGRDVLVGRDFDLVRQPGDVCPYRGLKALGEGDTRFLIGRSREIDTVVGRITGNSKTTAIVGASGVGKSSLIWAGVVPAIRSHGYNIVVVDLLNEPATRLTADTADRPTVAIIDQAEQLFGADVETAALAAAIEAAIQGATFAHVILSFRSDFQPAFEQFKALQAIIDDSLVRIQALDGSNWREIIESPAKAVGLTLEPGLVDVIERDIPPTASALPLLAVALEATWALRYAGRLEIAGYRAAGGVAQALERQAEAVFKHLTASETQLAEWAFAMRLTQQDGGLEPTRRRATMAELSSSSFGDASDLVNRFVDKRLLAVSGSLGAPSTTVEIVHEALLRSWPRLADQWVRGTAVENRRLQGWIADATAEWTRNDRSSDALRLGPQLDLAQSAMTHRTLQLTDDETSFVTAAVRERDSQIQRAAVARSLRRWLGAAAVVAVIAGSVAGLAVRRSVREQRLSNEAKALRTSAAALALAPDHRDLAALLAVEGVARWHTVDSWSALIDVLSAPGSVAYLRGRNDSPVAAATNAKRNGQSVLVIADGSPNVRMVDPARGGDVTEPIETGLPLVEMLATMDDGRVIAGNRAGELVALGLDGTASVPIAAVQSSRLRQVVAVGPRVLATNEDGELLTWDLSGSPAAMPRASIGRPFPSITITAMAAMKDGRVALGSEKGTIAIWSAADARIESELPGVSANFIVDLAVDLSSQRIAAVGTGEVVIWDGQSEEVRVPGSLASVGWIDSETLIGGRPNGEVVELSTPSGAIIGSIRRGHHELVRSVLPVPGRSVVSLDQRGVAILWSAAEQSPIATINRQPASIDDLVVNTNGEPVAAAYPSRLALTDSGVIRLDSARGALAPDGALLIGVPPGRQGTEVAALARDVVAIGLDNGDIIVKRRDNEIRLRHDGGTIRGLAISPDGRYIAAAALDPADLRARVPIKLFDLSAGGVETLDNHELFVDSLQFSPNGKMLASGSDDRTIVIWDVASRKPLQTLRGHQDLILAMQWVNDDVLVSAGQDATVRIWDANRGLPLGGPLSSGIDNDITALGIGEQTIYAAQGRSIVSWRFGPEAWLATACRLADRDMNTNERQTYGITTAESICQLNSTALAKVTFPGT